MEMLRKPLSCESQSMKKWIPNLAEWIVVHFEWEQNFY